MNLLALKGGVRHRITAYNTGGTGKRGPAIPNSTLKEVQSPIGLKTG
jgi:hypothetical protein